MCIIVAKPQDIAVPGEGILRNCFFNNGDGAGFMVADGKEVRIRKGFMDWDAFAEALAAEGDLSEKAVVLHFRIATHGKVKPSCCHPFPVTSDMKRLRSLECRDSLCVAHNGIIAGMKTSDDVSDTMAYVAGVLAPLRRLAPSFIFSQDALAVVEATVGSKMAFLDASGELATVGSFLEHEGVLYSNSTYANSVRSYRSYASVWDGLEERYGGSECEQKGADVFGLPYSVCDDCPMGMECFEWAPHCMSEWEAMEHVEACCEAEELMCA